MRARMSSLGILVVALLLVSCGETSAGGNIATTSGSAANARPSDRVALALNSGAAQTVAGLQARVASYQSDGEVLAQLGLDCGRHLVLAQPPTSAVDSADVQAIKDFLAATHKGVDGAPLPGARIPSSLLWAAGALPSDHDPPACDGILELSNTGSQPIVIAGVGIIVNDGPIAPTFHYNQLDVCSFGAGHGFGCGPGCTGDCGGVGSCGYEIDLNLGNDVQAGKRYQATLTNPNDPGAPINPGCPWPLLLNPGDDTVIGITVSPPVHSPTGIYRVTPFVVTASGTSLEYPKLVAQLVYVSASDFTCFGYHSGHFVPIQPNDGVRHRCL